MSAEPMNDTYLRPSTAELSTVRDCNPFASLSQTAWKAMRRESRIQSVSSHCVLLAEGSCPEHLHVVLQGCIEFSLRTNSREATLGIVRRGECFDLPAVVNGQPCLACARSCTPSRLLSIPAKSVRDALAGNLAFAQALVRELADDVRLEVCANGAIKLLSSIERLAARLLDYEREQGSRRRLTLPCDKRTLASLLAMTPENLSRAFAALGSAGVVVEGPSITLRDRRALEAVARRGAEVVPRAVKSLS